MITTVSDFYKTLRALCEERNITVNELVKTLELSSGSPTAWKKGVIPRNNTLQKIAAYFGVSMDHLLQYEPQGSSNLSEAEQKLIHSYRKLSDHSKALVQLVIDHELKG